MAYYSDNDLFYSALYGGAVYQLDGAVMEDPFRKNGDNSHSPVLTNLTTGEQVFVRLVNSNSINHLVEKYGLKTRVSPRRDTLLWPIDLIEITDIIISECNQFVDNEYSSDDRPIDTENVKFALAFPLDDYKTVQSLESILRKTDSICWKNPEIVRIAIQLVASINALNIDGFVYNDLHLSRIFLTNKGSVMFDYSSLAFSRVEMNIEQPLQTLQNDNYPVEFGDPSIFQKRIDSADFQSQNYSVCALLFYLFFGKHAYDGRLLIGYPDDSEQTHYIKFRDYHKMPVFIFDPDDTQNSLGSFGEDEDTIQLWETCPNEIKDLLLLALKRGTAERTGADRAPSAKDWLGCFYRCGWMKS